MPGAPLQAGEITLSHAFERGTPPFRQFMAGRTDPGTLVALAVSLTLAVTVTIAKFIGCTLPMLAKKLGFDPAVMASPFITTVVDALSLLTFFSIAKAIIGL